MVRKIGMRRATIVLRARDCTGQTAVARITLAFDDRYRRRIRMTDDNGEDFLLDLAETTRIEDGDGLLLDTGEIIIVRAADEDVLDIVCHDAAEAARVAWHLGNRHTPVQVLGTGALRIVYDHVLEHMVERLGAHAQRRRAPFAPEPGAYAAGGHNHSHEHSHGHLHGDGDSHEHGHHH
jgi:urease accessory protein